VSAIDLRGVRPPMARYLADLTKRYDVCALRRFSPDKRYALTACFLVEIHKTILDYISALHDQLMTRKLREAKNAFEQRYRRLLRQYRRGLATLIATGQTLLDPARSPDTSLAALLQELDADDLQEAVTICTDCHRLEERGEIDALRARYPGLRRYLRAFYGLPFQGEPGTNAVLKGLEIIRQVKDGTVKTLPADTPTVFVPNKFWPALHTTDGTLDRRTWELGLAVALRDGLRSGDVYLPESRRHVSFSNLVYDPARWQYERADAYLDFKLPQEPDDFCMQLQRVFDDVADRTERGLTSNEFVTIRQYRLHLKRRDALELPRRIIHLRRTIEGALPRVRIEDLLTQVDAWCDFTRAFRRPGEQALQDPHRFTTLLATLIAHGTNLNRTTEDSYTA
jgi:hypothetical protein